jgi:hypothetical protein
MYGVQKKGNGETIADRLAGGERKERENGTRNERLQQDELL